MRDGFQALETIDLPVPVTFVYVPAPGGETGGGTPVFVYGQATPATEWSVTHPFGVLPASIQVVDESGVYLIPDVAEISATRVVLLFAVPTAGTATLLKGA